MTNYYNGGYDGGYDGFSMSNRAREAYDNGIMPMSKWNKREILIMIIHLLKKNKIRYFLAIVDIGIIIIPTN